MSLDPDAQSSFMMLVSAQFSRGAGSNPCSLRRYELFWEANTEPELTKLCYMFIKLGMRKPWDAEKRVHPEVTTKEINSSEHGKIWSSWIFSNKKAAWGSSSSRLLSLL